MFAQNLATANRAVGITPIFHVTSIICVSFHTGLVHVGIILDSTELYSWEI